MFYIEISIKLHERILISIKDTVSNKVLLLYLLFQIYSVTELLIQDLLVNTRITTASHLEGLLEVSYG